MSHNLKLAAIDDDIAVVPRLDDLRVLRMLRTTKTANHARFALAALALVRLNSGKHPRPKLFAPIPGVKETKQIAAEGRSIKWQEAFLKRLEEGGLIESIADGLVAVSAVNRAAFEQVAASAFNENSIELKRLLWPSDYADEVNPSEAAAGVATSPDDERAPSDQAQLLTELTGALSALVGTMQTTLASVSVLETSMTSIEQRLGAKVDAVQSAVRSIETIAESFKQGSARYDNLIRLLEDEDRRSLTILAERLSEASGRAKSVVNQLDGVASKEAELLGRLKELLEKRK